ncbi:unnamed protein product, partial [Didymodactylos carnosus]
IKHSPKNRTDEETLCLISTWEEYYNRLMFDKTKRNNPVYLDMINSLKDLIPRRSLSVDDIKHKITNLVSEYRKNNSSRELLGPAPYKIIWSSTQTSSAITQSTSPIMIERPAASLKEATTTGKNRSNLKKKKPVDIRLNMMKEMMEKMDAANEVVNKSDVKVIEILEEQTVLQEHALQNENEFLNIFRSIAANLRNNDK